MPFYIPVTNKQEEIPQTQKLQYSKFKHAAYSRLKVSPTPQFKKHNHLQSLIKPSTLRNSEVWT